VREAPWDTFRASSPLRLAKELTEGAAGEAVEGGGLFMLVEGKEKTDYPRESEVKRQKH
jgi:hypothetical protein